MTRLRSALLAATGALALAAPAAAQTFPAPQPQFVVAAPESAFTLSAYGEVRTAPDTATVSFGVLTEAATAAEAMRLNRERMTAVMATLKRAGIADKDVRTSNLDLSPQYDYRDNQTPRLRGYQASNQVTVTVNDLTRVGTTLDAVVQAGVNQVHGVGFGLKDPEVAMNAARLEAVQALQAKADLYARATGHRLTGLRSLSEGGAWAPQPQPVYAVARAETAMAAPPPPTPVAPGELTVRADVTGVFGIAPAR